jgi:hypothetical protein
MSPQDGLAALLRGERPTGVYRWPGTYVADIVEQTALAAGWAFAPVWGMATKQDTLESLGIALGFGEHYGRNLDALADCLRDLAGPTLLLWADWAGLSENDPAAMRGILHVLGQAEGLAVLLVGEGPAEIGVPELAGQ